MSEALDRLRTVRSRIAAAERARGEGEYGPVTLIAVSKTFSAAAIRPVVEAGCRAFGENRVQEAEAKWPELKADFPDLELHLLGPLQSNKAAEAVALFDVIQSVDRDKIAGAIAAEGKRTGKRPRLYVQVNIGQEPQKAGIAPAEAAEFVARCRDFHGLSVEGLMCIPPAGADPVPFFRQMRRLAALAGTDRLSMGMSGDFETAIREGADLVRVGSAIFGSRTATPAGNGDQP